MKILSRDEFIFYKKSLKFIKPYKYNIIIIYISTIISNILSLLPVYFMGKLIDFIISSDLNNVKIILLRLIFIYCLNILFSIIETYYSNLTTNQIIRNIKNETFKKTINLSMHNIDNINSGEILSVLEGDTQKIVQFFIIDLLDLAVSAVTLLVSIVFVFRLSIKLSLIASLTFPITFFANILFGKKLKSYSMEIRKITDNYFRFFNENFERIKQIKCLGVENIIYRKYKLLTNNLCEDNLRLSLVSMASSVFSMTVTSISEWIIMFVAATMIISSSLTIGTFVAFNGYLSKFMQSMSQLLKLNINIQVTSVSLRRIFNILDLPVEEMNKSGETLEIDNEIKINNLKFSYDKDKKMVINDLSATFYPNSISVIVGQNGSGKTTLFDLMVRLYEVEAGEVRFGNSNLKDINIKELRKNITYIHQNPILFDTTIIENFKYINTNITIHEIIDFCKLVDLNDYIESLPKGYNTVLGDGGFKLSGGEKQKLAIAVSLAKGSRILILDEITSNLDVNSTIKIIELLEELKKFCNIIVISHDPMLIKKIDNIFLMMHGTIIAHGSHSELLETCDEYIEIFGRLEKGA